jgi:Zn-dependent peptidase ImmA (M78 family)/transcriptional regulator with XRE-family HTH domain
VTTFSPTRLALARSRRALTQAALGAQVGITPRSIGGYEKGQMQPSGEVAEAIARELRFPLGFFYEPEVDRVETLQVSFRALSRLRARDRGASLAAADLAVMLASWIERHFDLPSLLVSVFSGVSPEDAAQAVRSEWGLGEAPVPNVVHQLEAHGVRVFSLAEGLDLDAFSFWVSGTPFVMLNTTKSAERSRFDGAHELGHLVLHRHELLAGSKEVEREAQAFASAFLMPASAMCGMVSGNIDLESLIKLKHYWGVSAAAAAFRLHHLGLITDWNYRWVFREMSVRGWRSREPQPMERERSQILPKVYAALAAEGTTKRHIATALQLPLAEIETLSFGLAQLDAVGHPAADRGPETPPPILKLIEP